MEPGSPAEIMTGARLLKALVESDAKLASIRCRVDRNKDFPYRELDAAVLEQQNIRLAIQIWYTKNKDSIHE